MLWKKTTHSRHINFSSHAIQYITVSVQEQPEILITDSKLQTQTPSRKTNRVNMSKHLLCRRLTYLLLDKQQRHQQLASCLVYAWAFKEYRSSFGC